MRRAREKKLMVVAYENGVIQVSDPVQMPSQRLPDPPDEGQYMLAVCENGYGKITGIDQFRIQRRGGKGVRLIEASERNGPLVATLMVSKDDEVLIQTKRGKVVRIPVASIRETGRIAQGVGLMDVAEGDCVSVAAIVPRDIE